MYQIHPCFDTPADNTMIWRYMNFTKFVSLLETKKLYLSRSDKFEDPFEGSWPKLNVEHRLDGLPLPQEQIMKINKLLSSSSQKMLEHIYINCWHMNTCESDAMWRIYVHGNEGVAIQTTINQLKESITDKTNVYIGRVKYIDYKHDFIPIYNQSNIFDPFLYKRNSFSHENEVRVVALGNIERLANGEGEELLGVNIDIEPSVLIQNIYVAPFAALWFHNLVQSILVKYGYNIGVNQSEILGKPMY